VNSGDSQTSEPSPRRFVLFGTLCALCVALLAVYVLVVRPAASDSAPISPRDLVGAETDRGTTSEQSVAKVGEAAPEVTLTKFGGGRLDLASLRGKPVVVNFWASSCAPCIKEMPLLERVHQQLGDAVEFVGIDAFETPDVGQGMIDRTGVTYTQTVDDSNLALSRFAGTQLPHTVILRADGTVAALHNTSITDDQVLLDLIDQAR
jgi:thiol-disulfide isomerase/thioredoxin